MSRPVIRLVVEHGVLCFPFGGYDLDDSSSLERQQNVTSLLMRHYPAGDCDTIPSHVRGKKHKINLAYALFDEREMNPFFPADAIIELPNGKPFDFDALVD